MIQQRKKLLWLYILLGAAATALTLGILLLTLKLISPKTEPEPEETQLSTAAPTDPVDPAETETLPQSEFSPRDFVYDGDYLTCTAGEFILGIDVSSHQQVIDWEQVKDAGITFVMVRLGYRGQASAGTLKEDRYARQNLEGARQAGLLVGAYFYSQATSTQEAVEEAELALSILDGFQLDLPLVFDWEQETRNAGMDKRTVTACAYAFCRVVEKAGYSPMIYFNSYQAQSLMDLSYLTEYPWWLAKYTLDTEFVCRFDMLQYSCTGKVAGIEGYVDMDLLNIAGIS